MVKKTLKIIKAKETAQPLQTFELNLFLYRWAAFCVVDTSKPISPAILNLGKSH
jgi:hypothetical protein